MTLQQSGGLAALACAATYLVGFALLVTLLGPLGYGTNASDPAAVVGFIEARPGILIASNTVIYLVNALAPAMLVVALHARLVATTPGWAAVTRAFGLIWAPLMVGAGMIANVAVERAADLAPTDPAAAAEVWEFLHAVELGRGGRNQIVGGIWILGVSMAGLFGRSIGKVAGVIGIITGVGGLATIVPALVDSAGTVFGLGAIAWFSAIGIVLHRAALPSPRS